MRSRNNGREGGGSISSFIDSLLSPPVLQNPLRRSNSEKTPNDSLTVTRENPPAEPKSPTIRLTPIKSKSKSEDKASQVFLNSKSYGDQPSVDNSMIVSRISEVTEAAVGSGEAKEVRFRENLIKRNNHHRREGVRRDSRTPSILKRSQTLRYNSYQFMQVGVGLCRAVSGRASSGRRRARWWTTARGGRRRPTKW